MELLKRFFPEKSLPANFLTIDLGSDTVKVLAFKNSHEELVVVGTGKQSLPWSAVRGGGIASEEAVLEALNLAVSEATSNLKEHFTTAVVGLTGEMVVNFTTAARLHRPATEQLVTSKELAETEQKLIDVAFIEAEKQLTPFMGLPEVEIELITSKLVSVKIDNFVVENPVGFKGDQLEISLFTAFAPKFYLETWRKLIKTAKLNLFAFASENFALATALQRQRSEALNAILLDVGGSCTEVTVVFGGSVVGSRSLGLGGRYFSEAVSFKLGLSFDEAELKKVAYGSKHLPEEATLTIGKTLNDCLPIWLDGLALALGDIDGIKVLPTKVLVVGGGSQLPGVIKSLQNQPWDKNLPLGGPLVVENLSQTPLGVKSEVTLSPVFITAVALGLVAAAGL